MFRTCSLVGMLLVAASLATAAEPAKARTGLVLTPGQKDYLTLEPILVKVALEDTSVKSLPLLVGATKADSVFSFDIKPAVKPRSGAKPLPFEGAPRYVPALRLGSPPRLVEPSEARRAGLVDLLEWYQFPAEGTFTVRAVVKQGDTTLTSEPVTLTLRRPDKKDKEWGPVDRLHHLPWSNYCVNAFCGDTFDVVKRWPDSKLAPYCHFHNGMHSMQKKEYKQAVASFRTLLEKHPTCLLVPNANRALLQCYVAEGKWVEANELLGAPSPRKGITGK
jgi:hypothetical protein